MLPRQLGKRSIKDVVDALQHMSIEELGGIDVLQSLYSLNDYSHVFADLRAFTGDTTKLSFGEQFLFEVPHFLLHCSSHSWVPLYRLIGQSP